MKSAPGNDNVTAPEIDLDRHAFVEASAGTGKTFLIENLTARIIAEGRAQIDQMLIVTFTEKAAGELRERIRSRLHADAKAAEDAGPRVLLEKALMRFDGAVVDTIHGFCSQLLRQHGADLGFAPGLDLVDDRKALTELLNHRMRERWPAEYGPHLVSLLNQTDLDKWNGAVPALAAATLGERDRLRPSLDQSVLSLAQEFDASLDGEQKELLALVMEAAWKVETIRQLQGDLALWKDEHGRTSHFDTVDKVARALCRNSAAGESFLGALRGRFRFGIVDEFQDTDPRQWSIFKRIFLESPGSKLIVVGDPKQAIYGFRGGDIGTFFAARDEMASRPNCQFVNLRTNYRASPDMIAAANAVFSSNPWFGPGSRITFTDASPAPALSAKFRLAADPTGRPAFVAVQPKVDAPRMAKRAFQLFMVEEIKRILGGMEIVPGQRPPRPANAGDIAVLVRNRSDGEFVEKILSASGIPCSFYKKSDLFGSREANELLYLMSWIADPGNASKMRKALVTDFFRFPLHDVKEGAPDERVRSLVFHWADLASRRAWPAFFRSIMEDSAFLAGFVVSSFGVDGERAALEQIIEILMKEALVRRLDLSGVIDTLVRLSIGHGIVEEEDLRRQETEEHRVQIMTIHAAKGLEFPVVFVAGGLTKMMPHLLSYFEYYDEANGQSARVYDLRSKDKASEARHVENEIEEDKRLYYVAFTRAALKLYVPIFHYPKNGTFLGPGSRFIREAAVSAYASGVVALISVDETGREVGGAGDVSVAAAFDGPGYAAAAPVSFRAAALVPAVAGRLVHVRSYSSIAHALDAANPAESPGANDGRDLDRPASSDEMSDAEALDQIFRGAAAGNFFHTLLENVDFQEFQASEKLPGLSRTVHSARILNEALDLYGITQDDEIYKTARQSAFDVIERTLSTPLSLADGIRLSHVKPTDRIHELEFFLKTDALTGPLEDLVEKGGYVRGFIDLVFRNGEKYYILDWKSNFIPEGYGRAAMESVMQSHRYHLQAAIYVTAVVKWLRSRIPDFDYERSFGGVFYLFLRGMNPSQTESGVYAFRPTLEEAGL